MSAKTDFVNQFLAELPATYSQALPVRSSIKLLAEAIYDASGSLTPADLSVTLAKMATMATASVLGRISADTGAPEVLSAANIRTIIGLVTSITGASTDAQIPSAKLLYDQLALKQAKLKTVTTLTVATVLTAANSGTVFVLNGVAGADITLPAVATSSGVHYKFIVGAAIATADWTITAATKKIQGSALVAGSHVAAVNEDIISFVVATATLGDFVELDCDGVNWYVNGSAVTTGAITFTAP